MTPEALHIWPRHEFMLIALPNLDGSFTLTLFVAADGKTSFAAIEEVGAARRFFAEHFADALALMPDFDEQWSSNPRSRLSHVTTDRFHAGTRCILLGDAAHAIVPFYGQGMNAAFEDCRILMDLLDENDGRFDARLCESFTAARKPNADAIRDLALENFVEMRDKVAHPAFHLRKKLDAALHELAPHHYIPLYTMVTFSNIPYAEARARAKRQDRLLSMGLRLVGAAGLGAAIAVAGRVAGRDTSA
jgi:kynurenine 3-monooxygenase